MRYPIVIEPAAEATAFGVVVPDLPGCFSAGDTLDDAVSNAAQAAALWIEDAIARHLAIPAPATLDAIRADPQWAGWVFGFAEIDPASRRRYGRAGQHQTAPAGAGSPRRPCPRGWREPQRLVVSLALHA